MIDMLKKWKLAMKSEPRADYTRIGDNDPEWDEFWGNKYLKQTKVDLHKIDGIDENGRASEDLGVLFA